MGEGCVALSALTLLQPVSSTVYPVAGERLDEYLRGACYVSPPHRAPVSTIEYQALRGSA